MKEYIADEFVRLRRENLLKDWTNGVYLITNKTKRMHYVGKSIHVRDRVFAHFSGRGNGDVYHHLMSGDQLTVRFYPHNKNQYQSIEELEYHLIRIYEANTKGYNRQKGSPR